MPARKKKDIPTERALITIPQVPDAEITLEPEVPKRFSILHLGKKESISEVPDAPEPYYIATKDGMLIHRKLRIGRSILPTKAGPPNLGEGTDGKFWYSAPPIPKELCSQIVDFFRVVYEDIKTEAEVFLLLHRTEPIWKLWIPSQQVTGVSVHSVYEPISSAEYGIPADYVRVGSVHSHCMMGAFHSSVDIGDAEAFEGIHLTIGKVMNEEPEFATMIMVNKSTWEYKHDAVGDWTDLSTPAPDFWFDFVGRPGDETIKGFELFEKYPKPTPVVTATQSSYGQFGSSWQRTSPNDWGHYVPQGGSSIKPYAWYEDGLWDDEAWDDYLKKRYGNAASMISTNPSEKWEPKSFDDRDYEDIRTYAEFGSDKPNAFALFVDSLPDEILDKMLSASTLSDKEWEALEISKSPVLDLRNLLMMKMARMSVLLETVGMEVTPFKITPAKLTKES